MNQQPNNALDKLKAFAGGLKAALSKDYSLQDLRNLPNAISQWWQSATVNSASEKNDAETGKGNTPPLIVNSAAEFDFARLLKSSQAFIVRQRKQVLILLILVLFAFLYQKMIAPYGNRLSQQLEMRPAQWSQLQNLIRVSKSSAIGDSAFASNVGLSTVTSLDEQELQRILSILTARGIKPSVFRLTSDNPPRIEFQANEVLFSSFLEVLEEFRGTWRLYPTQMSVIANGGAGMVSISGVLSQYSSNSASLSQSGVPQ